MAVCRCFRLCFCHPAASDQFFIGSKFWKNTRCSYCYGLIPVGFIDVSTYCLPVYSVSPGDLLIFWPSSKKLSDNTIWVIVSILCILLAAIPTTRVMVLSGACNDLAIWGFYGCKVGNSFATLSYSIYKNTY